MPGGDRTGPAGMGPMTGRGAGFCAGYGAPGFLNRGYGAGGGFFGGRGGRGWRNRFWSTGVPGWRHFGGNPLPGGMPFYGQPETSTNELDALREQARWLEESLKDIQARMEPLSSKDKTE